jgi:magnesium transporter
MDILYFQNKEIPTDLMSVESLPSEGFIWLDVVRGEKADWPGLVRELTGITIHERHLQDAENIQHPSYFDSTSEYEMMIFRGLATAEDELRVFASRPTVLLLFEHLLVTVRQGDSRSIPHTKEYLNKRSSRIPLRPAGLMHLVLNAIVDRFLELREPLSLQLEDWRRNLLDPRHPFNDWMALMQQRDKLRTLELLCEEQEDALTLWRSNTSVELDDHIAVRYSDLLEHIRRVTKFSADQQNAIESLVQLHFSAVAHRTNEIMRLLTVVSAIFLPLSLIAGIFGMNFDNMPELHYSNAYFYALGGMISAAAIMLAIFRWKRWF